VVSWSTALRACDAPSARSSGLCAAYAPGALRDLTGDASMPLLFASVLMLLTVAAVTAFWRLESRPAPPV
jgi:hypothetical protein